MNGDIPPRTTPSGVSSRTPTRGLHRCPPPDTRNGQTVMRPVQSPTTPAMPPARMMAKRPISVGAEESFAVLAAALDVEQGCGREQHGGEEQELQAGRVEEEERVGGRGARDDRLLASRPGGDAFVGLAGQAELEGVGSGEEVGQQRQARGQVEHEVERVVDEHGQCQQRLYAERGHHECGDRGAVCVLLAEEGRHVVGSRGDVHDFGRHQRPRQVGAEHGDDDRDADEHLAPVADDRLEDADHRRLPGRGEFGLRHHRVAREGHQREDRQHAQEAQHGGLADVLALLGVAGVDARALDADEHEGRDQHGVADLLVEVAELAVGRRRPVVGENAGVEGDEQDHDEDQDRQDLEDGDDAVDDRGVADAACDQDVEEPHADGRDRDREEGGAVAEAVEEGAQRRADEDPVEGVAGHRAGPEADRGVEAGIVAESGLGIDEHTGVELGLADGEVLEHEREHQHPGAGDGPRDQRAQDPGGHPEPGREREHPSPDHPPDDHRGQGGEGHLRHGARGRLGGRRDTRGARRTHRAHDRRGSARRAPSPKWGGRTLPTWFEHLCDHRSMRGGYGTGEHGTLADAWPVRRRTSSDHRRRPARRGTALSTASRACWWSGVVGSVAGRAGCSRCSGSTPSAGRHCSRRGPGERERSEMGRRT